MKPGDVVVGRYQIEALVAEGALSTAFRATDRARGKPCLVKISSQPAGAKALEAEAKAAAGLEGPGLPRFIDHGAVGDGTSYLAFEWVDGLPLDQVLTGGALPPSSALAVARGVAAALVALHRRD